MEGSLFQETKLFAAIAMSGARALLIGRRALVVLGLPVLTRDYDYWLHAEDIALFNKAVEDFGLFPNRSAEESRASGRYVLENDEKVDVLVARIVFTVDRVRVAFDEIWARRQTINIDGHAKVAIPSLNDLILTKRFSARPKDAEDIRMLEVLRSQDPAGEEPQG